MIQDWIVHWQSLAMSDPVRTQKLLFKLGYVDRVDLGVVASSGPVAAARDRYNSIRDASRLWSWTSLFAKPPSAKDFRPRSAVRVCVLGGNGVGKSSLVWGASNLTPPGAADVLGIEKGQAPEKAYESIVVGARLIHPAVVDDRSPSSSGAPISPSHGVASRDNCSVEAVGHLTNPLCLALVAVPHDHVYKYLKISGQSCDCAVLVFQCGDEASLHTAWKLEQVLPDHVPRFYVGHKSDLFQSSGHKYDLELLENHEKVLEQASLYVQQHGLPPVVLTSSYTDADTSVSKLISQIKEVLLKPEIAQPRAFKEKQASQALWQKAAQVAAVATVVVSVGAAVAFRSQLGDWVRSAWACVWNTSCRLLGNSLPASWSSGSLFSPSASSLSIAATAALASTLTTSAASSSTT